MSLLRLGCKESAWLSHIFAELVAVEDSRVFWDHTTPGYPRVFLPRKVLTGMGNFGWLKSIMEERSVGQFWYRKAGIEKAIKFTQPLLSDSEYVAVKNKRSFTEVLRTAVRAPEDPFGPLVEPIAEGAPVAVGTDRRKDDFGDAQ
jgi:hypothetical protein